MIRGLLPPPLALLLPPSGGGAAPVAWDHPDASVLLDGTAEYIDVGAIFAGLTLSDPWSLTITTKKTATGNASLLGADPVGGGANFIKFYNGQLSIAGPNGRIDTTCARLGQPIAFDAGDWYQITVVYPGSGHVSVYVNGAIVGYRVVNTFSYGTRTTGFALGSHWGGDFCDAHVTAFGVWAGTALSSLEVRQMYNVRDIIDPESAGLPAPTTWMPFVQTDDATGTTGSIANTKGTDGTPMATEAGDLKTTLPVPVTWDGDGHIDLYVNDHFASTATDIMDVANNDGFTVAFKVTAGTPTTSARAMFSKKTAADYSSGWRISIATDGNLNCAISDGTNSRSVKSTWSTGAFYVCKWTGSEWYVWADNVAQTLTPVHSDTVGTATGNTQPLRLGRMRDDTLSADGDYDFVAMWSSALSDSVRAEVGITHADWSAISVPPTCHVPVVAVDGATLHDIGTDDPGWGLIVNASTVIVYP